MGTTMTPRCAHPKNAATQAAELGPQSSDAVAFANLAGAEFAGETVGRVGDVAIGGMNYAIAVRLGESDFSAKAREIPQIISDADSLHLASVTHLAAWVNGGESLDLGRI